MYTLQPGTSQWTEVSEQLVHGSLSRQAGWLQLLSNTLDAMASSIDVVNEYVYSIQISTVVEKLETPSPAV